MIKEPLYITFIAMTYRNKLVSKIKNITNRNLNNGYALIQSNVCMHNTMPCLLDQVTFC